MPRDAVSRTANVERICPSNEVVLCFVFVMSEGFEGRYHGDERR